MTQEDPIKSLKLRKCDKWHSQYAEEGQELLEALDSLERFIREYEWTRFAYRFYFPPMV